MYDYYENDARAQLLLREEQYEEEKELELEAEVKKPPQHFHQFPARLLRG